MLLQLARTPAKAAQLAAQEVIPVRGSIQQPEKYLELLKTKHIDVVVDVSGAMADATVLLKQMVDAGKERLSRYEEFGVPNGPKLGFVYVSGMWVHGSDKSDLVNDGDPFTGTEARNKPLGMVAWRPEVERSVLSKETTAYLDTAIVRSALTYGRDHAIWTGFFMEVLKGVKDGASKVSIPLDPEAVVALAHSDDAASGIGAVVERVGTLAGTGIYPVFDMCSSIEGLRAIFEGFGRALGFKGTVELVGVKEGDYLGDALSASTVGDSGRAKALLGWSPKRMSMLQGIDVYANAWKAAFEKGGE
jgi:nucleoside-diphosphate-sugar epimerase